MPTGKKLETQPSIQTCGFSPHKYPRFGRQALSALSRSHYCLSSQCNMTLPMSLSVSAEGGNLRVSHHSPVHWLWR